MGVDPNQLSQDKDFLGMSPQDQMGYLSSQDPDFAKMAPADQAGYIGHLTGKSVQMAAPPNAGLAPPPRPKFLGTGPTKEGSSAGQSPLIGNAPTSDTAGTMLDTIKAAASDLGGMAKGVPAALSMALPTGDPRLMADQMDQRGKAAAAIAQNADAEKKAGYSIPYRVASAAAQGLAGVNVPGMEKSAAEGSVGGVLGHAGAPLIALGATEAATHAPWDAGVDAIKSAVAPATDVVKGAAKASGIGLSPIEKLTKAAGPSVRDTNFPQALETAAPELARQHAATPIKTVGDMAEGAHTAADNLWKQKIEPQIARNATEVINERLPASAPEGFPKAEAQGSIGDSIREGIDPGMARMFPKETAVVEGFAKRLDQPMTLAEANENLRALNAKLKSYYKMTPEGRAAIGVTDGMTSAMEEGAAGLRQKMYDKLDSLGETDPAGLRKQYGALKQVQDVFRKRAIVSGRQAPLNLPQMLSLAGGAGEAAGALLTGHPLAAAAGAAPMALTTLLKFLNSPDSLVNRGLAGLPAAAEEPFNLGPPAGRVPPPLQQILNLSGGENIPGQDLKLTPPGDMPPDVQRPLSFMEGPNSNASGPVAPGGRGTALTPLQQILNSAKPAPQPSVPRSLGAAAAAPTVEEIPQVLREAAGLQGGHAGNGVSSVEELARPGTNYVVSPQGKLTFHGKAFAPEVTPKGSAHVTVLPDGTLRVNDGTLTPTMEKALKNGAKIPKTISMADVQQEEKAA